jgi:hypothetical protein
MTDLTLDADLFGHCPAPQLVRLDRSIDRDRPCCQNIATIHPRPAGPHAAELKCAGCGAHRGWLRREALDFVAEVSARFGAPTTPITLRDSTIGEHTMSDTKHFEQKDGQGALFKNDKKQKDTHPDYVGNIKVEGIEFRLSAWIKTSNSGTKYMSISAMPKESAGRPTSNKSNDFNDEIGF